MGRDERHTLASVLVKSGHASKDALGSIIGDQDVTNDEDLAAFLVAGGFLGEELVDKAMGICRQLKSANMREQAEARMMLVQLSIDNVDQHRERHRVEAETMLSNLVLDIL